MMNRHKKYRDAGTTRYIARSVYLPVFLYIITDCKLKYFQNHEDDLLRMMSITHTTTDHCITDR